MELPEGTRAYLLAPVVRGRKGEYRKELAEWQKAGFTRVRIDGEFYPIEEAPALDKKFKHDIEVVVDRIAVKDGLQTRLADSFETALKLAEGLAYIDLADGVVPGREGEDQGGGAMKGRGCPPTASSFPRNSPVRFRASPSKRSSRACSPSTARKARARPVTGSVKSSCSIRNWSSPTKR